VTADDDLANRIASLTPTGTRFVARFVESIANPPVAELGDGAPTWLTSSSEWVEAFSLGLAAHHAVTHEPLALTAFEVVFKNACEAAGWQVPPSGSPTERFVDTTVTTDDGVERRLSLKSTAAQKLSKSTALISKLTEAAWIQDMRSSAKRRQRTLELFDEYRKAVDSIIMLRAFRTGQVVPERYELIEIPAAIFASLEQTTNDDFSADGPTIDCSYAGETAAARVLLDRSDAKITVKGIKLSSAVIHGNWILG